MTADANEQLETAERLLTTEHTLAAKHGLTLSDTLSWDGVLFASADGELVLLHYDCIEPHQDQSPGIVVYYNPIVVDPSVDLACQECSEPVYKALLPYYPPPSDS